MIYLGSNTNAHSISSTAQDEHKVPGSSIYALSRLAIVSSHKMSTEIPENKSHSPTAGLKHWMGGKRNRDETWIASTFNKQKNLPLRILLVCLNDRHRRTRLPWLIQTNQDVQHGLNDRNTFALMSKWNGLFVVRVCAFLTTRSYHKNIFWF